MLRSATASVHVCRVNALTGVSRQGLRGRFGSALTRLMISQHLDAAPGFTLPLSCRALDWVHACSPCGRNVTVHPERHPSLDFTVDIRHHTSFSVYRGIGHATGRGYDQGWPSLTSTPLPGHPCDPPPGFHVDPKAYPPQALTPQKRENSHQLYRSVAGNYETGRYRA